MSQKTNSLKFNVKLSVIGVIVIIISVFFPLYSTITESSFESSCQLKQTISLIEEYSFTIVPNSCPDWQIEQSRLDETAEVANTMWKEMGLYSPQMGGGLSTSMPLLLRIVVGLGLALAGIIRKKAWLIVLGSLPVIFIVPMIYITNTYFFANIVKATSFHLELGGILLGLGSALLLGSGIIQMVENRKVHKLGSI